MVDHGLHVAANVLDDIGPGTGDLILVVAGQPEHAFEMRAFAPGVAEDPVCGSMNASVGQWLTTTGAAPSAYRVCKCLFDGITKWIKGWQSTAGRPRPGSRSRTTTKGAGRRTR